MTAACPSRRAWRDSQEFVQVQLGFVNGAFRVCLVRRWRGRARDRFSRWELGRRVEAGVGGGIFRLYPGETGQVNVDAHLAYADFGVFSVVVYGDYLPCRFMPLINTVSPAASGREASRRLRSGAGGGSSTAARSLRTRSSWRGAGGAEPDAGAAPIAATPGRLRACGLSRGSAHGVGARGVHHVVPVADEVFDLFFQLAAERFGVGARLESLPCWSGGAGARFGVH